MDIGKKGGQVWNHLFPLRNFRTSILSIKRIANLDPEIEEKYEDESPELYQSSL